MILTSSMVLRLHNIIQFSPNVMTSVAYRTLAGMAIVICITPLAAGFTGMLTCVDVDRRNAVDSQLPDAKGKRGTSSEVIPSSRDFFPTRSMPLQEFPKMSDGFRG
ncbi:hypothetical protein PYCCODRAFT_999988 [Trametes coccinea BRFM310]|uniref:Uncharacterized protein n=1 Tax=Trametes coccinea (strain BRFM310) TaxID=1353009 RepID=A0A1Y2IBC9_TRAC3|nr:hypothetical protein PYCCODRAFT_999988 [Trametes coccinea BRFM310]